MLQKSHCLESEHSRDKEQQIHTGMLSDQVDQLPLLVKETRAALCRCDPPTRIRLPGGGNAVTSRIRAGSGRRQGGQKRRGEHKKRLGSLGWLGPDRKVE